MRMLTVGILATLLSLPAAVSALAEEDRVRVEIPESAESRSIVDAFSRQITVTPTGKPQQVSVSAPIQFEFGSARLTPAGRALLDVIAAALNDPVLIANTFVIEGHTDAVGSSESNLLLSRQRAKAVRQYLMTRGVVSARLTAAGFGEYRLLKGKAPDDAANRRVELVKE